MVKRIIIDIPIYRNKVFLYVGDTIEELKSKIISDYNYSVDIDTFDGLVFTLNQLDTGVLNDIMLLVNPVPLDTVHHECIHIAWNLLDYHGIKIDLNNHESLTYLSAYIFENIVAILEKINGKTKSKNNKKLKKVS